MTKMTGFASTTFFAISLASMVANAQHAPLPPLPAPMNIPAVGAQTDAAYAPQPILPGGIVIPLFPPNSPYLQKDKINIPEQYNMDGSVHGRIASIVHIHNPSIEVHLASKGMNTGAAVILIAGGGHRTLNVGGESADFVPYFYNFGVNTVILRSRLQSDGYKAQTDEVYDTQQAIRMVRAYSKEWGIDPKKIGVMGFSAGAELVAAAAVLFEDWDKKNNDPSDPFAGTSSRPDFAGIIYPGPSPFAPNRTAPPIPRNVPPAFIVCGGSGDQGHAMWATQYFTAMLAISVPNIEMHIYAFGKHPGDKLPDGSNQTGGLTYRKFEPYGTWQDRFIDWFHDLGFLGAPGEETRAAKDIEAYLATPPRGPGRGSPPTVPPPAGGRGK